MIDISYLRFTGSREADCRKFDYWLSLMPDGIREKILKYYRWQDALSCLAGNVLILKAMQAMGATGGILEQIRTDEYGRPHIGQSSCTFNVSHSGEYVICAASRTCRVGVDIEKIKTVCIDDFALQMLDEEREQIITSYNRQLSFFEYWTRKEAVIKGNGKGLSLGLKSFIVRSNHTRVEECDWYLYPLDIDREYAGFLAVNSPVQPGAISLKRVDYFS